jgi:hypothetical protein
MAQERTGIVVGTNKGHVCSPPTFFSSSLPRVSVHFGPLSSSRAQSDSSSGQPPSIRSKPEESCQNIGTQSVEEEEKERESKPTRICGGNNLMID